MNIRLIICLSCLLFIACRNSTPQKNSVNEKDSLRVSSKIEEPTENEKDSIKVLVHTEEIVDSVKEIREVFLDNKRYSEYKKPYYKLENQPLDPFWNKSIFRPKKTDDSILMENPFKNLLKTYISISKLDGSYIFFTQGSESDAFTLAYIGDTTLTFLDMEGWFVYYYKNLNFENDKYIIDYKGAFADTVRLEIKIIEKTNEIQVWKTTVNDNGVVRVHYDLKAPLSYALKLPMLVISNTRGLDTEYEGIDELNLEKLFNE